MLMILNSDRQIRILLYLTNTGRTRPSSRGRPSSTTQPSSTTVIGARIVPTARLRSIYRSWFLLVGQRRGRLIPARIIDQRKAVIEQSRLFWFVRIMWPYRTKVRTFSVIKPALFQGLIHQKRHWRQWVSKQAKHCFWRWSRPVEPEFSQGRLRVGGSARISIHLVLKTILTHELSEEECFYYLNSTMQNPLHF